MFQEVVHWIRLGSAGGSYGEPFGRAGLRAAIEKARAENPSPTVQRAVQTELMLLRRCLGRVRQSEGSAPSKREKAALARMQRREQYRLVTMLGEMSRGLPNPAVRKQVSLLAAIRRAQGELPGKTASPVDDARAVLYRYAVTNFDFKDRLKGFTHLFPAEGDPLSAAAERATRGTEKLLEKVLNGAQRTAGNAGLCALGL